MSDRLPRSAKRNLDPATKSFTVPENQHFVRTCERGNTRAHVDGNAADILAHYLALAGIDAGRIFNSKLIDFVADGAAQRTPRAGPSKVARMP